MFLKVQFPLVFERCPSPFREPHWPSTSISEDDDDEDDDDEDDDDEDEDDELEVAPTPLAPAPKSMSFSTFVPPSLFNAGCLSLGLLSSRVSVVVGLARAQSGGTGCIWMEGAPCRFFRF